MDLKDFDLQFDKKCIGVDEAGAGPLAGPVVAAAVYIKNKNFNIEGINDSKKLSDKKRREIFEKIKESKDIIYSFSIIDNKKIDEINILNSRLLAMKEAIEKLNFKLEEYIVLIDGNKKIKGYLFDQECIIKGDSKSLSIASASIIAKVIRDDIMINYDKIYPEYLFFKHKGYPTKSHYEKIKEFGICDIHRKTFLKKVIAK